MAKPTTRLQFKDYCLDNKYSRWYFSLIEKAEQRKWTKKSAPCYVEGHHIVPKSIIKNDIVVFLTAREHFICHLLLPKMMKDENQKLKMNIAITAMRINKEKRYINSRFFESIKNKNLLKGAKRSLETRKKMSVKRKKILSENKEVYNNLVEHLNKIRLPMAGENNPMYGVRGELNSNYGKPKTKEHREKIRNSLLGKKYTEERCKNMSKNCPKNSLGKKWYHNIETKEEKYFIFGQQPENFILGRLRNG
jgi:uncharacterized protein YifN (PemK superfamily)